MQPCLEFMLIKLRDFYPESQALRCNTVIRCEKFARINDRNRWKCGVRRLHALCNRSRQPPLHLTLGRWSAVLVGEKAVKHVGTVGAPFPSELDSIGLAGDQSSRTEILQFSAEQRFHRSPETLRELHA